MDPLDDEPAPTDDAPEAHPGGAQQDGGPRADEEPLSAIRQRHQRARRRRALAISGALVVVLVIGVLVYPRLSAKPPTGAQESGYENTQSVPGAPARKATVNHVPYAEPVDGKCAFTYLPRQARVSADGAVLFTASRYDGASLVDLGGSGAFGRAGEARLGPAHWLYDDLVVSADPYGIAAFAPKEP